MFYVTEHFFQMSVILNAYVSYKPGKVILVCVCLQAHLTDSRVKRGHG